MVWWAGLGGWRRRRGFSSQFFGRPLKKSGKSPRNAEVIIYNTQSVGGFHIAEALGVPGIMADALPTWVTTGAFPEGDVPTSKNLPGDGETESDGPGRNPAHSPEALLCASGL